MRLKTINGAPLCERLDFGEDTLLPAEECQDYWAVATRRFEYTTQDTPVTKWRSLTSTKHTRLHTGWSQPFLPGHDSPRHRFSMSFLGPKSSGIPGLSENNTSILDSTPTFDHLVVTPDDFVQHSFIFHDTLLSSQVFQGADADDTVASASFMTTSFGATMSDISSLSRVEDRSLIVHAPPDMITQSLISLPNAQQLISMYPQTPTPNLLCAVVNNPEQREVVVRKGGYKMNLWELNLADDTRSDFKVSFWLRPPRESDSEQRHAPDLPLQTLGRIRVGDILLIRKVALTSFRGTVYGQSLNPAITRARTSIDVLMSSSGTSAELLRGLPAVVESHFTRVKRWAKMHVAAKSAETRKRHGSATCTERRGKRPSVGTKYDECLPPDTMSSV